MAVSLSERRVYGSALPRCRRLARRRRRAKVGALGPGVLGCAVHAARAVQVYDPHHEVAALLMNDIALCLNIQGNFGDAHDMLVEALTLFRRPGATTLTQQACALAHNNLAVSLAALGRPRDAQSHMRAALKGIRAMSSPFVSPQPTLYLQAALLMQLNVRAL